MARFFMRGRIWGNRDHMLTEKTMNKRNHFVAVALICLLLGFVMRDTTGEHSANAAPPEATGKLVGRFQISAHGTGTSYGCYLVDTATGDLWHSGSGTQGFSKASGGPSFVH
jgi:hypothetical protein